MTAVAVNQLRTVAVLFCDPLGVYPRMPSVDAWPKERNAKVYNQRFPVVAHPDCGPWSKLRHLCTQQDPHCGPIAVRVVQRLGGCVEHPAHSRLFDYMALPKPGDATDCYGGRTYYVEQVWWGHPCKKPTWIYVVGVDQRRVMRDIDRARKCGGTATHCVSRDVKRMSSRLLRASPQIARRTPPLFASWLVSLARASEVRP